MSPRTRVILFVGGALHAVLVWQSVIGVIQAGMVLGQARVDYVDDAGGMILDRLGEAALIIVAVPFGWFCMKLAGVARPWRAELLAVVITIPLTALIGTVGAFARYFVRTDLAASFFWTASIVVGVALSGAISFYLIGRRDRARPLLQATRNAVEPQ